MKKVILILLVLVILGMVGYWMVKGDTAKNEVVPSESESTGEMVDRKGSGEGDLPEALPKNIETAVLSAVGSYRGSAVATRQFERGGFMHMVEAEIDDPETGKFYEGWLVRQTTEGPDFFSTGKMEKFEGSYMLAYQARENFPNHTLVVITEETEANGLDGNPEAHVLEGEFVNN